MSATERERRDAGRGDGPELGPHGQASRRRFLELAGATGGLAALSTVMAACGSGAEGGGEATEETGPPEPATDLEIVNFVLFLEFLEETFYDEVLASGEVRDRELRRLLPDIRQNEREHADLLASLASQLGGTAVPRPKTDFNSVINDGEERILEVASTLENVGAAAYLGQLPRIQNGPLLEAVLSIHSVEGRHAAALNEVAGNGFVGESDLLGSIPDGAFALGMTRTEALEQTAPFVEV